MRSVEGFGRPYEDCMYKPVAPQLLGWDKELAY